MRVDSVGTRASGAILGAVLLMTSMSPMASAEGETTLGAINSQVYAEYHESRRGSGASQNDTTDGQANETGASGVTDGSPSTINSGPSGPTAEELRQRKIDRIKAKNRAMVAAYKRQLAARNMLVADGACLNDSCPEIKDPDLLELPGPLEGGGNGGSAGGPTYIPGITAEEAAYIAISVVLDVPQVEPGIGPEPHDNQWGMAIVGYPYWLYADGPTRVGPVTDSSAGLTVSLQAELRTVVFDMGDGTKINCGGPGTPYSSSVGVKEESPTCGHVYQEMSQDQPGGVYTVTAIAYWDVAYSTPIGSGTIPIVTSSQREVLVGELQTVIEE